MALKTSKPELYKQLIKLIDKKNLNIEDIRNDPSILKLNNNKPIGYGTVKKIILNERGKEVLNKIQSIKNYAKGSLRQEAEKKITQIMNDYYDRSMGTKQLTKKYFPDSPDAKKGLSSTVLENVINENKDPKRTRVDVKGTGAKGYSPAKIILKNPDAKAEFIKFANTKGNTLEDSMKEAAKIAKKYAPKGITKIAPYTSRTGFKDSGLRKLITKKVQLGRKTVDPKVTERLKKAAKAINDTEIPKGNIDSNSPIVKILAKKAGLEEKEFLNSVRTIKQDKNRIKLSKKVLKNLGRFPDPGFVRELLKMQGYSRSTINTVNAVERAASSITQAGSQLEHALPKSIIKEFKLPRKYLLTAERTSNFINQFKKQFDQQLLNAAKAHATGDLSYKDYKRQVEAISKIVSDKTGGYKIGYVDFVDGKPVAVTPQESLLKGEGELGKKTKALKNYFKNAVYHNRLFENYQRNPKDPAFGTLRQEIQQSKYKFVKEVEAEKTARAIENFTTKEQFFNFYKKNPDNIFFRALSKAAQMKGGKGQAIIGGTATLALLSSALQADEPVREQRPTNQIKYNPDVGAFTEEKDVNGITAQTKVDQSNLLDWVAENPVTSIGLGLGTQEAFKQKAAGSGYTKSLLKSILPTLGKLGGPAGTALIEGRSIAQQAGEGRSAAEIATDPMNYLGLAFMETLSKTGKLQDPGALNKILRLGISPRNIAMISRGFGIPGLLVSGGIMGVQKLQQIADTEMDVDKSGDISEEERSNYYRSIENDFEIGGA